MDAVLIAYLYSLVILTSVPTVTAQSTASVSITVAPGFDQVRPCVRGILFEYVYAVQEYLNCGNPLMNGCYCRADFSSEVSIFISTEVSDACTPGPVTDDLSSAESLYSNYCVTAIIRMTRLWVSSEYPISCICSTEYLKFQGRRSAL